MRTLPCDHTALNSRLRRGFEIGENIGESMLSNLSVVAKALLVKLMTGSCCCKTVSFC